MTERQGEGKIYVKTIDNKTYKFEKSDYVILPDSISGKGVLISSKSLVKDTDFNGSIAFKDVKSLELNQSSTQTTILLSATIVVLGIILAATFQGPDLSGGSL